MKKRIIIQNIKNINTMCFDLPGTGLHVLTGKNGSGKTTLFTCISRICNSNAYRLGFPSSTNQSFDAFTGAIHYQVDDKEVIYSRRVSGEWRPDKKNSDVLELFGYKQIISITTKDKRVFSQEEIIPRKRNTDNWLNSTLNRIFETEKFEKMVKITTGDLRRGRAEERDRRRNIAYAIPLGENLFYTERSFSFGEIVVINMLFDIQNVSSGSLILIDELELAIHPSAQIRLIQCLEKMASDKNLTILISTHSASIIKMRKNVIFLERQDTGDIDVLYNCPPAKAIGAIGMREDTNPDIVVLVEDAMAKSFFHALKQKYISLQSEASYLDIRVLEIGGYKNVIQFFLEAKNYIFYNNVYVVAFMDKDVETDIIPYHQFVSHELIQKYTDNSYYLHFLPYTPEVLLTRTFHAQKDKLLKFLRELYNNQQLSYSITSKIDFTDYEQPFPDFESSEGYNAFIEKRGTFRSTCKKESERIAKSLAEQVNLTVEEVYRATFKFSVDSFDETKINIRQILAPIMKRLSKPIQKQP